MREDAARALRADSHELDLREPRPARPAAAPAYQPPRRREAPERAYGSRGRGESLPHAGGVAGRRTVEIRGQAPAPRRRPSSSAAAFAARPDRTAQWAFLLALFLVVMAIATAHG